MNASVTPEKRAKILHQVRIMLDIADRDTTPPGEATAAREKAEQLMRDYRIVEEQALAVDPHTLAPEIRTIEICRKGSEFGSEYGQLFSDVARHVGVLARFVWTGSHLSAQTVGYAFDLDVAELLFTAARLTFTEHLEPGVDPSLSEAENVYRLRRAGIPRNRVAYLIWGASTGSDGAPAHGKVAKIYKTEAARRGEVAALSGRGISAPLYRASYASGFVARLRTRLWNARQGADKVGGAVTLAGRAERVAEAFYVAFPEYRPSTEVAERTEPEPCVPCARTKHASGKCRDHRPWVATKADRARWERETESVAARAGRGAGAAAADGVALDGREPIRRLDDRTGEERETTRAVQGVLGN